MDLYRSSFLDGAVDRDPKGYCPRFLVFLNDLQVYISPNRAWSIPPELYENTERHENGVPNRWLLIYYFQIW